MTVPTVPKPSPTVPKGTVPSTVPTVPRPYVVGDGGAGDGHSRQGQPTVPTIHTLPRCTS